MLNDAITGRCDKCAVEKISHNESYSQLGKHTFIIRFDCNRNKIFYVIRKPKLRARYFGEKKKAIKTQVFCSESKKKSMSYGIFEHQ